MNWKQFTTVGNPIHRDLALWIINKVNELKAIHNSSLTLLMIHSSQIALCCVGMLWIAFMSVFRRGTRKTVNH